MTQQPSALHQGIRLSLQMICDEIDDLFWDYTARLHNDAPTLSGCRYFFPGSQLQPNTLYIVPEDRISDFPVNEYPYMTPADADGAAANIHSVKKTSEVILNMCLDIFQRYKEFESAMNSIITEDGSLTELCRHGCSFFRNPLYIHDYMFSIIALPKRVQGMLTFDENAETGEMHIPLWLINDFKFDDAYQATLHQRHAAIWGNDQYPHNIRSLYVNLWDGDYYIGRLLINEIESSLKPGQFYLAEVFAEYIKMVIRRDRLKSQHTYKDHEETLHALLTGQSVHDSDLQAMFNTLGWRRDDTFLCLKIASQDSGISVRSDSALRSQLSTMLQGSVQFYHEQRLCILMNLSVHQASPSELATMLAPLIRDSYTFAGLSNPVSSSSDLYYASRQADLVLDYIRRRRTTRWMLQFSDCTLDYILNDIGKEIPRRMLIPPALVALRQYDEEKGTQYYETLRTFILSERSIPKTSSALFVHRTTLLYRLEKLNEILHMDLENSDVRLHLMLAFKFLEHTEQ